MATDIADISENNLTINKTSKLNDGPIVYVSCPIALEATSSFDYFVSIINFLVEDIKNLLNKEVIIKVPTGKSKEEQTKILTGIFSSYQFYSAIIIAPNSSKALKDFFEENESKLKKILNANIPIFTIDKPIRKLKSGFQIPYVTANWYNGGKLAAMEYERLLEKLDHPKKKALIIRGGEGSESRIRGFNSHLKKRKDIIVNRTKEKLDYSRESAFNYLYENRSKYILSNYDVIFCCNDEMALGVRELLMMENVPADLVKIIGFDSTIEFKWLQRRQTNHLYTSIDVKLMRQVKQLVSFLSDFDINVFLKNNKKYCHTEPLLYKNK